MPNKQEDAQNVNKQLESTAAEHVITDYIPEKTKTTVPTVYPDIEYVNRTLP